MTENKFFINSHLSQVTAKLPTLVHKRDETGSHWHLLSTSSALYLSQNRESRWELSNRGGGETTTVRTVVTASTMAEEKKTKNFYVKNISKVNMKV